MKSSHRKLCTGWSDVLTRRSLVGRGTTLLKTLNPFITRHSSAPTSRRATAYPSKPCLAAAGATTPNDTVLVPDHGEHLTTAA